MKKLDKLLIDRCRELNLDYEISLVVITCCQTRLQKKTMLDWLSQNYLKGPNSMQVLRTAIEIRGDIKEFLSRKKLNNLLIDGCKILKLEFEISLAVLVCCRTALQKATMLDWMLKHYQENPTNLQVLDIAREIRDNV